MIVLPYNVALCSKQKVLNQVIITPNTLLARRPRSSLTFGKDISFQLGNCPHCYIHGKYINGRICAANSAKMYLVSNHQGRWEDPDDGSGSEYDDDDNEDEDEVEENDLDFKGDWGAENGATASVNKLKDLSTIIYEENYLKEVEQLLSPEERAILQSHELPNLDKISTEKWNSLHTFALSGQIKFMDKLLENGLHIDVADKDGLTALHHATMAKKEAVISHLLRKGANPQARDLAGVTPLHYAVQVGAMQTVKLLIKYNVDLNVADNEGWTALHVAVQSRNRDIVKILLINGADKTRRNKDGRTPLDLSLSYGKDFKSYDITKLLKLVPANNREF